MSFVGSVRDRSRALEARVRQLAGVVKAMLREFTPEERAFFESVQPYTMTSIERVMALRDAVGYITKAEIAGAIVECGVWRGGSMLATATTLLEVGDDHRDLYLFDTFTGMTPPSSDDVANDGRPASDLLGKVRPKTGARDVWCLADLADVQATMARCDYPAERITYVKGPVEETIPAGAPDTIALLRLDTDWYESTKHELEHLYPRLAVGGVLIIDDYGHWQGARKAVDEYFAPHPVYLQRIDQTGRSTVKPASLG